MAAEALVQRGYRRLAFLGGPRTATSTQDRVAGFLGALAPYPEIRVTTSYATDYSFDAGRAEMQRLLAETPGQPVSRERCLDVVWGVGAVPTTRTVDTHIASLRAKLEPGSPVDGAARFFKTVHGVGYRLDLGPDSATNPESGSVSVPGPGSDPELDSAPSRPEAAPISQVDAASRPGKGRKP
jgi:DNA-binding response OmpR family regulator